MFTIFHAHAFTRLTCTDVSSLAAAYAFAFAFVKDHPYDDGEKGIGFLAMVTFPSERHLLAAMNIA